MDTATSTATSPDHANHSAATPTAAVFAPSPLLTITAENGTGGATEIHLHAGGQGFWIARMLVALGVRTSLCAALGGEIGPVLEALVAAEGVDIVPGPTTHGNGAYIHDRRDGDRATVAEMDPPPLSRHDVDALHHAALGAGMAADVSVLGGPHTPDVVSAEVYRRLAADLQALGKPVVADLSGESLTAALTGGVTVLKVSHDDLIDDGRAQGDDLPDLISAMRELGDQGARHVVLSRGPDPTIALVDGQPLEVLGPELELVDHRGAGDSMTAGLAAALALGKTTTSALRLAAAAGTTNITRRGLATGQRKVIEQMTEHIVIRPLESV